MDFKIENGEMVIANGDFLIGDANDDHIESLLISNKGEWKQHPLTGVGILKYINSPVDRNLKTQLEKQIRLQLENDKFKNIRVDFEAFDNININALKDD